MVKSRKFPTFDDALVYLEKKGKLEHFGMINDYHVYNLTVDRVLYRLFVYKDGKVEVRDTVYPRF